MAGSAKSEDELARTATARPESQAGIEADPVGDSLGKFRLERQLGIGGMGVVHAAFDPDLERRVALKVLRVVDHKGRERLFREAKAMARLAHPNVVTVHEVGSEAGRDFVAMELIEGETLADWLKLAERSESEIVAAFTAAGRGLAAAHDAGLVHGDFKPHNVLRRRSDGRIVVTDFGLARSIEAPEKIALDATQRLDAAGVERTGSLLGTPAYMSPEQWHGGSIGPAADQFAFCVALWEALTGERPFKGDTIEQLRAQVDMGARALDETKLPRRLRRSICRGLDADPHKRWPSMHALLAAITRAERRPLAAFIIGGGALIAAGVVVALVSSTPGDDCTAPVLDPGTVWSVSSRTALVEQGLGRVAKVFDDDMTKWQLMRTGACKAEPEARAPKLTCLDGVLTRFAAVYEATRTLPMAEADSVLGQLVDPDVCMSPDPPRLTLAPTPETVRALALALDADRGKESKTTEADIRKLTDSQLTDACAQAIGLTALVSISKDATVRRAAMAQASTAIEGCRDERLRADMALMAIPYQTEFPIGPRGQEAIKKAQVAVQRVPQPDLLAAIDMLKAGIVAQQEKWDDALALAEQASKKLAARGNRKAQLATEIARNEYRLQRSRLADLEAVRASAKQFRPLADAIRDRDLTRGFELQDASARFMLGDVKSAHALINSLWEPDTENKDVPLAPKAPVDGIVVDEAGKPVPNASVIVSPEIVGLDSVGFQLRNGAERMTTTDANGKFSIPDAIARGRVMARSGALLSDGIDTGKNLKLVLHQTRKITGKVDLGTREATEGTVLAFPTDGQQNSAVFVAPINADGTFELDNAPVGKLSIGYQPSGRNANGKFQPLAASREATTHVEIETETSTRTVDVVVRSSIAVTLDFAQLFMFPGRHKFQTLGELLSEVSLGNTRIENARHLVGEQIPKTVIDKVRAGDLVAHFVTVPQGEVTVCAVGIMGDLLDPAVSVKIQAHLRELLVNCEVLGPADQSAVVEAPPQKRFD